MGPANSGKDRPGDGRSFLASIQTIGRGTIVQDGRVADLEPGDFALYDFTQPYESIFQNDFQQYVLTLPGSALRSRLRETDTLTARKVCGSPRCRPPHDQHDQVSCNRHRYSGAGFCCGVVAESVENILVAGLCSLPGAADPLVSNLTAFYRDQIKAYAGPAIARPAHFRSTRSPLTCGFRASTVHRALADERLR